MNQDPYKVLGVSPTASDEEVKRAYYALAKKYHPDNYSADNPLADLATEKMQEVNAAYDEIQRMRASGARGQSYSRQSYAGEGSAEYMQIRRMINANRFGAADSALENIAVADRGAEWHYLKSITLMHRGWVNDAMRELEIACSMNPSNPEYQQAKQMFNRTANGYGSTYYNAGYHRGGGCSDSDLCTTLCCMNLLCNFCQ
jgi:curved DNA-binding protein CbpA